MISWFSEVQVVPMEFHNSSFPEFQGAQVWVEFKSSLENESDWKSDVSLMDQQSFGWHFSCASVAATVSLLAVINLLYPASSSRLKNAARDWFISWGVKESNDAPSGPFYGNVHKDRELRKKTIILIISDRGFRVSAVGTLNATPRLGPDGTQNLSWLWPPPSGAGSWWIPLSVSTPQLYICVSLIPINCLNIVIGCPVPLHVAMVTGGRTA